MRGRGGGRWAPLGGVVPVFAVPGSAEEAQLLAGFILGAGSGDRKTRTA